MPEAIVLFIFLFSLLFLLVIFNKWKEYEIRPYTHARAEELSMLDLYKYGLGL